MKTSVQLKRCQRKTGEQGGGDTSVTDSEMKHTLLEINKHLNNQRGVKERKDLGRKSALNKFPEGTKRTILRMLSKDETVDAAPDELENSMLEFTAAGSTVNAHMQSHIY